MVRFLIDQPGKIKVSLGERSFISSSEKRRLKIVKK